MTRRREFSDRAVLKVYFEATDLRRLTEMARAESRLVSEYVRVLVLEHLNEGGNGKAVRQDKPVHLAGRSTVAPERPVERAGLGTCPHKKQRGELCYKCDPKFGLPSVI